MLHHKHEMYMDHCPKCGARLVTIFDELHKKETKRCSHFPKCDYSQEGPIKKLPERK